MSSSNNLVPLKIMDNGKEIVITYQEMVNYHGYNMLGGIALGYKILKFIFDRLDEIPERGNFYFYSGIGPNGKGLIDTLELVTRAKTLGQIDHDVKDIIDIDAPCTPRDGKYYFIIKYKGQETKIKLKENLIPEAFYTYSRLSYKRIADGVEMSSEEYKGLMDARKELEELVKGATPEDLFDVL